MRDAFLLLFNGLRADCLGPPSVGGLLSRFGLAGGGSHLPRLERFLEGGVRFERAYASGTFAQPSLATVLTGCHPPRHGLRCPVDSLSGGVETIWEVFGRAGYRTLLANGPEGAAVLGLTRGLDREFVGDDGELFDELAAADPEGRPWLAVVCFDDLTSPYLHTEEPPTAGYLDEYLAAIRALAGRYSLDVSIPEEYTRDPDRLAEAWHLLERSLFYKGLAHPTENLVPLYAAGLAKFDGGRWAAFEERLAASPFAGRSVVAATALFAETIYRPQGSAVDLFLHGTPPVEGAVHVPLSLTAPDLEPGRVGGPVGLVDLAPTLAELAGVEWPVASSHGRSLVASARSGWAPERPCYSETAAAHLDRSIEEHLRQATAVGLAPAHRCRIVRRDLRQGRHLYAEIGDQLRSSDLGGDDGSFVETLYERLLGRLAPPAERQAWVDRIATGGFGRQQAVGLLLRQAKLENRYRLHDVEADPEERVNLLALDEDRYREIAVGLQTELVRRSLDLPEGASVDDELRLG